MMKAGLFRGLVLSVATLAPGLLVPASKVQAATYSAYAGPNVFGPWTRVGAHAGAITYTISASPVGNTAIVGEVAYYAANGQRKVEPFHGSTVIRTCNCYATVEVRFKGIPVGSAVNVNVSP